jgi:hypothetical protein
MGGVNSSPTVILWQVPGVASETVQEAASHRNLQPLTFNLQPVYRWPIIGFWDFEFFHSPHQGLPEFTSLISIFRNDVNRLP